MTRREAVLKPYDQANHLKFIAKRLAEFFADDPEKITYWLTTDNEQLGNVPPALFIMVNKAHRLCDYFNCAKKGKLI